MAKRTKINYIVLCDESNLNLELDLCTWCDFADFIEETLIVPFDASIKEDKEGFIIRFKTILGLKKALQNYMQSLLTIKKNYYKIPYNNRIS